MAPTWSKALGNQLDGHHPSLLCPQLTEAANFFGMSERQKDTLLGGALMAAFFAVGAPAALVVSDTWAWTGQGPGPGFGARTAAWAGEGVRVALGESVEVLGARATLVGLVRCGQHSGEHASRNSALRDAVWG